MEAVKLDELNSPKKEAMIEALEKSLGIVSTAVKMAGISRGTHYNWLKEDTDYKKAVDSIQDGVLDFAESHLRYSSSRPKARSADISNGKR